MILFDTRDADVAQFGGSSPNGRKLQQLAAPLDIPPLEPIPSDHVLTRTFYLIQDFPGRHAARDVWVEAAPPDAELVDGMPFRNLNDNVTPVVIGGNDWAAAWATGTSEAPAPVASVLGRPHDNVSRHVFRGGNFLMPRVFNRHRIELNVAALPGSLAAVERETLGHLAANTARVKIGEPVLSAGRLDVEVAVRNLAGHKLPTAYPSRRAWLMVTVRDRAGKTVFSSGALNEDGSIAGNDNDADGSRYEPHYREVTQPDQVQIYESVMADRRGEVTTGLLSAVRYIKDNRLLPAGFDKATAEKDIAVQGAAAEDPDFKDGGDTVRYSVPVDRDNGPFTVDVSLWYQPIGFRWAHNLSQQDAAEIKRFVSYYSSMSEGSAVILAAGRAASAP